ncbi:MAG: hypothetical protein KDC71_20940 [Acidobacteria bacterium]|nr:hypothetical protein [Acidobacteriota bacterium]
MKGMLFLVFCVTSMAWGQIDSIAFASNGPNVASLNWPNGDWYVRAILIDDMGVEVGPISNQIMFTLTNSWPSITVTMAADAPLTYALRFYRSASPFSPGDSGIESNTVSCGNGTNCDLMSPANISLANSLNGGWTGATVLPVTLVKIAIE